MKKLIYLLGFSLLLVSCTSTYKYDFSNLGDNLLEKDKSIAISVSEDGSYGSDVYDGSGRKLSNVIKKTLQPYSKNVTIAKRNETIDDFTAEELSKADYIIIPSILHWEDRATAWSALPDKVEVCIEIYNSNKELLKSGTFSGTSSSMTLSSNDPSELLEEPLKEFFKTVFEK